MEKKLENRMRGNKKSPQNGTEEDTREGRSGKRRRGVERKGLKRKGVELREEKKEGYVASLIMHK